jgi:endonuclease/exonuclease/phosphatase family metal-dependent hydrolase
MRSSFAACLLPSLLVCGACSSDPATTADARPTGDGTQDAPPLDVASGTQWLIKVLAFNIHGLAGDRGQYKAIGEALAARRGQGEQPDLVLLQEAFLAVPDPLREKAAYPHEARGPPATDQRLVDSGLIALSDHPILSSQHRAYTDCEAEDCAANKGLLVIEIQPPGMPEPLLVATTHMQAQSEWDEARRQQMDEAAAFLETLGYRSLSSIFAGDFNTKPNRASYDHFLGLTPYADVGRFCLDTPAVCTVELDDAGEADLGDVWEGTNDRHYFFAAASSGYTIEPVYLTRNFTERYNGTDHYSDHWGYEVHYRLSWK